MPWMSHPRWRICLQCLPPENLGQLPGTQLTLVVYRQAGVRQGVIEPCRVQWLNPIGRSWYSWTLRGASYAGIIWHDRDKNGERNFCQLIILEWWIKRHHSKIIGLTFHLFRRLPLAPFYFSLYFTILVLHFQFWNLEFWLLDSKLEI